MHVETAIKRAGDLVHEVREVDFIHRRRAELVAALVCRRLGLPIIRVRWLPPETRSRWGCTYPDRTDEVWVVLRAPAGEVETIAHEVRHVWQLTDYRWARPGLQTDEEREGDAAEYGRQIRAELAA